MDGDQPVAYGGRKSDGGKRAAGWQRQGTQQQVVRYYIIIITPTLGNPRDLPLTTMTTVQKIKVHIVHLIVSPVLMSITGNRR